MRIALALLLLGCSIIPRAQPTEPIAITESIPRVGALFGHSISSVPDLNLDGVNDFIIAALEGSVYVFSGATAEPIYQVERPAGLSYFGGSISGIDDIDGDGRGDFVVAAAYADNGGIRNAGIAFVFSGRAGTLLFVLESSFPTESGRFGLSTSAIPDVNEDGIDDILVGAPFEELGIAPDGFQGRVYLFSGADGRLLRYFDRPIRLGEIPYSGSNYGFSIAGIPDTNGDHNGDVLIGAWGDTVNGWSRAGRVYAHSGATGELLFELTSPPPFWEGYFGYAVASIGDVNGSGSADILVGAIGESNQITGRLSEGRAYVFDGLTGTLISAIDSPIGSEYAYFGYDLASVPDFDQDGMADFIIGAFREYVGVGGAGRAYVFSGATSELLYALNSPNRENWGLFGSSVVGLDDLDHDGRGDFMVGAHWEDVGQLEDAGRVYLYLSTLLVANEPSLEGLESFELSAVYPNPFVRRATIRFHLPRTTTVKLDVLDALGRWIATLTDRTYLGGDHSLAFDAANLPSGTYFIRMSAGNEVRIQRATHGD